MASLFSLLLSLSLLSACAKDVVRMPVCQFVDGLCVDSGIYNLPGNSLNLTAIQWVIATTAYCNSLSYLPTTAACDFARQCRSLPDRSCTIRPDLTDIARSCAGSPIRDIATCAIINNPTACKAAPEGCAWKDGRGCTSTSRLASSNSTAIYKALACPSLVGCCPTSDELYNHLTKCKANTTSAKACESVLGCFYGNGACSNKRFGAICSAQSRTSRAKCEAAAPSYNISMKHLADAAAIPPTTFGRPGKVPSLCIKARLDPVCRGS